MGNNLLEIIKDKNVGIVVKGVGNVGQAVLKELEKLGVTDNVKALVTSSGILLDPYKKKVCIEDFCAGGEKREKIIANNGNQIHQMLKLPLICRVASDEGNSKVIVIDVSNDPRIGQYETLIDKGFQVVTANKYESSLSDPRNAINLMQNPNYGYDTTVMAGRGAVTALQNEVLFGKENIFFMEGIFSGTLAYITKELEKGVPFSEAVASAMEKGYTEPHPMDDLDGMDVAKKLVILARTMGYEIGIEDVEVEGLLDDSFREIFDSIKAEYSDRPEKMREEFSRAIKEGGKDEYFKNLLKENEGKVPRYVASMKIVNGKPKFKVSLEFVEPNSEIGVAELNKLIIGIRRHIDIKKNNNKSETDKKVIAGLGAGPHATAQGILQDVYRVLQRT